MKNTIVSLALITASLGAIADASDVRMDTMASVNQTASVGWSRWDYNGGAFVKQGNQWIEYQAGQARARFIEQGRSSSYVYLYDASRHMTLRLSANRSYWRQPHTDWNFLYDGWAR